MALLVLFFCFSVLLITVLLTCFSFHYNKIELNIQPITLLLRKVKRPEIVEWSVCGEYYGIINDEILEIYTVETADVLHSFKLNSRIACIVFIQDGRVCIGDWSGNLVCFSHVSGEKLWEITESTMRLKALTVFENFLICVDGKGVICVYDVVNKTDKPKKMASYNTSCRITCVTVSKLMSEEDRPPKKKQKVIDYSKLIKNEKSERKIKFEDEVSPSPSHAICSPRTQKWTVETINS